MIIIYAALRGIDPSIYEAARIDGANAWQIALRIKVPMISSALVLILVFALIGTLQFFTEPQILRSSPRAPSRPTSPRTCTRIAGVLATPVQLRVDDLVRARHRGLRPGRTCSSSSPASERTQVMTVTPVERTRARRTSSHDHRAPARRRARPAACLAHRPRAARCSTSSSRSGGSSSQHQGHGGPVHRQRGPLWFDDDIQLCPELRRAVHLQGGIYWRWLGNSFLYAFAGGIGATVLAVLAGYGFAKYRFRGRALIFAILLGSVMVPTDGPGHPDLRAARAGAASINTIWAVILPVAAEPVRRLPDARLHAGCGARRAARRRPRRRRGRDPHVLPGRAAAAAPAIVTVLLLSVVAHLEQLLPAAGRALGQPAAPGHGRPRPAGRRTASTPAPAASRCGTSSSSGARLGAPADHLVPLPAAVLAGRPVARKPQVSRPARPTRRDRRPNSAHPKDTNDHAARLTIDPHFAVGPINRRLFGSFVEHLGRCVYDGIYEPGHPTADERRLPPRRHRAGAASSASRPSATPAATSSPATAGRTASGPRDERPRRLDLAWHSTETNEVGLRRVRVVARQGRQRADDGRQPRHPRRPGGARPARVREHPRRHGAVRPARRATAAPSRTTCGCGASATRWTARGSSATAPRTTTASSRRQTAQGDAPGRPGPRARGLRQLRARSMPTFGEWERVVLEHTYDDVDFISCHAYYERATATSAASSPRRSTWTTSSRRSSRPPTTSAPCSGSDEDDQHLLRRVERLVPSTATTDVDKITGVDDWPVAPRLLEDVYSVADAVVFGNLLISLLQHADRVTRGEPRAAGQRDRADHDRARRPGLAADDLLPVRDHLAPRPRGSRSSCKLDSPDVRDRRCTARSRWSTPSATHDAETGDASRLPGQPQPRRRGHASTSTCAARRRSAREPCSRSGTTTSTRRTRCEDPERVGLRRTSRHAARRHRDHHPAAGVVDGLTLA